tara:strand:+ start:124 stop:639 length:516 start_codon:yes stop_codon:yes gene_type:complete
MTLKNKISKLIDVIKDTDINEIEISSFWGAQKIKLKKSNNDIIQNNISNSSSSNQSINSYDNSSESVTSNSNENLESKSETIPDNKNLDENLYDVITAPLVGTFYESPKPGEPPFINIGDLIEPGQSLCIIEAMKIFNAIESDFSGEITEILVQDGEPVEFGQPLFKFIKK